MSSLADALLVGLACLFTVEMIRALPPFRGWAERQIKPWACDLCMSFWSSVSWTVGLVWCGWMLPDAPLSFAAGGVCFALLQMIHREIPPPLPTLEYLDTDKVNGVAREPTSPLTRVGLE